MAGAAPPSYEEAVDSNREAASQDLQQRTRPRRAWLRLSTPSWLYPFYGIYYFFRHPYLYPHLRTRLVPCFLLSLFIYFNLFFWTYLPQVAFLAVWHGLNASAWLNGAFLVLGEGAAVIALLFEAFFVDETLVDVFDAVLVSEGHAELVSHGRAIEEDRSLNPTQRLGTPLPKVGKIYSPFNLRQIIEFVVFLPFNFIPWVGVPLFLLVTGHRAGPLQHWRYFKLLGWSKKERTEFEKRMSLPYTWFGTVHLTLQLVPGLSMLFLLTTAAGSALWVATLEKSRLARVEAESRSARVVEDYVDDPV